jgi:hypothetical protein
MLNLIIKKMEFFMKCKKTKKAIKTYGFIGKFLCACAGGVVGFVLSGFPLALLGVVLGSLAGHLFEKATIFNMR